MTIDPKAIRIGDELTIRVRVYSVPGPSDVNDGQVWASPVGCSVREVLTAGELRIDPTKAEAHHPAPPEPLKVGDLANLPTGNCPMTVVAVDGDQLWCKLRESGRNRSHERRELVRIEGPDTP